MEDKRWRAAALNLTPLPHETGSAAVMLPGWLCLLPACVHPGFRLAHAGPGHGAIGNGPAATRPQRIWCKLGCSHSLDRSLLSRPEMQVLWTGQVLYMTLVRKPSLAWGILHIPANISVGPYFLLLLGLLFHLHKVQDHKGLSLLLCVHGCSSPSKTGQSGLCNLTIFWCLGRLVASSTVGIVIHLCPMQTWALVFWKYWSGETLSSNTSLTFAYL